MNAKAMDNAGVPVIVWKYFQVTTELRPKNLGGRTSVPIGLNDVTAALRISNLLDENERLCCTRYSRIQIANGKISDTLAAANILLSVALMESNRLGITDQTKIRSIMRRAMSTGFVTPVITGTTQRMMLITTPLVPLENMIIKQRPLPTN